MNDCPSAHGPLELELIPKEATNPDASKIHDKRDPALAKQSSKQESAKVNFNFPASKNTYE